MIRFNCPHCERYYELPPALGQLPLVCKQCGNRIIPPPAPPDAPQPRKAEALSADPPPAPRPEPTSPPAVAPKPEPPPVKAEPPAPVPRPPAPPVVGKLPRPPAPTDDDDMLIAEPDSGPDIDFNVGGPTAASLSDAARTKPTDFDGPAGAETAIGGKTAPKPLPAVAPAAPVEPPPRPKRPAPSAAPAVPPAPEPEPKAGSGLFPFLADLLALVLLLAVGMLVGEFLARKPTGAILSDAGSAPTFPPLDLLMWAAPPLMLGLFYLLLSGRERTAGAWVRRKQRA